MRSKKAKASPKLESVSQAPWSLAILAIVIVFTAAIRIRMLSFPLERDEGEYAYAGQLILQGVPPYLLAYNLKLPGTYAAYALILSVFGQSQSGIHWGLLVVNAACIFLVFLLARRLFGALAAAAAAAGYALLSTSQSVLGMAGHATHFVVLAALGGVLLILKAEEGSRLWTFFWSGVLLGMAFIMKQHGAVFIIFGLAYVISSPMRGKGKIDRGFILRGLLFSAGAALPFALTCLVLLKAGVFEKFWFWTFSYAREYATEVSIKRAWPVFATAIRIVVGPSVWLWVLAGVGLVSIWWRKERRTEALFISVFLAFSFLGVSIGFFFRQHYFVLVLPAIAILIGAAVGLAARFLEARRLPAGLSFALASLLFVVPFGASLSAQWDMLFTITPEEACRRSYGKNPFPEAIEIARYISDHSTPTARIAVLGSEPEIYFYSNRRSATGYLYTYGLMENQPYAKQMQEEMIREIETARPEYIVFVKLNISWGIFSDSEKHIFDWFSRYAPAHYRLVGVVDQLPRGRPDYYWDAEAAGHSASPNAAVLVFSKNP